MQVRSYRLTLTYKALYKLRGIAIGLRAAALVTWSNLDGLMPAPPPALCAYDRACHLKHLLLNAMCIRTVRMRLVIVQLHGNGYVRTPAVIAMSGLTTVIIHTA